MKVILRIKRPNLLNALARKKESMYLFLYFFDFFIWAFSLWVLDESNGPTTDLFGLIHGPTQLRINSLYFHTKKKKKKRKQEDIYQVTCFYFRYCLGPSC